MTFDEWIEEEKQKLYDFFAVDHRSEGIEKFNQRKEALQIANQKNHYEKLMKGLLDNRLQIAPAKYCESMEGQLRMAQIERVEDRLKDLRFRYLECMEAREALEHEYNKDLS